MVFNRPKIIGFVACFFLIFSARALAADKMHTTKLPDISKNCDIKNVETMENGISQTEENRDNKTFQVAKIVIAASPECVFKIFTDYDHSTKIFSNLKKSKILTATGPKKTILCEAELAGGLFKFEYVLEFIEYPPSLVEWHRVSGAFKSNEGYWKFEPIDKGKFTLVTYSKYVDAGILFPQFLVKKELRSNMPVILDELKRSVEQVPN